MLEVNLVANGIALRTLAREDLDMVRCWRNEPAIRCNMLNQNYISVNQQARWFAGLKTDESQFYGVIGFRADSIGVVSLKTFGKLPLRGSAIVEPGLYIADERYRGTFLAFCAAITLNDFAFGQLQTNKMIARVLASNDAAIRFNSTLGYKFESIRDSRDFDNSENVKVMGLTTDDFGHASSKLRRFIRF